jgi:hypothetical protein
MGSQQEVQRGNSWGDDSEAGRKNGPMGEMLVSQGSGPTSWFTRTHIKRLRWDRYDSAGLWFQHAGGRSRQLSFSLKPAWANSEFQANQSYRCKTTPRNKRSKPVPGRWREVNHWGSVAASSADMARSSERFYLRRRWTGSEEQHLRLPSGLCVHMHTYVHVPYMHAPPYTHKHTVPCVPRISALHSHARICTCALHACTPPTHTNTQCKSRRYQRHTQTHNAKVGDINVLANFQEVAGSVLLFSIQEEGLWAFYKEERLYPSSTKRKGCIQCRGKSIRSTNKAQSGLENCLQKSKSNVYQT